jgi:hypothetical protein
MTHAGRLVWMRVASVLWGESATDIESPQSTYCSWCKSGLHGGGSPGDDFL